MLVMMRRKRRWMNLKSNRKSATGLLMVNWSRFPYFKIKLEGSTLITGVNGTGKSTVLDAITYLLTGNTQFNIAAKDRDRSIQAYVRGDTKSDGKARFLREGNIISYIAMEFYSPEDNNYFVVFVCFEMSNETMGSPSWYVSRNARLDDINFYSFDDNVLTVTPKSQLKIKGNRVSAKDFMGRDKGTEQVIKALGLRCSVAKYRSKLVKMMAFDPQKNIDKFIQECVLEPGEMTSLTSLREQRENFDRIQETYNLMLLSKHKLEEIEEQTTVYEKTKDELNKRKLMFLYQEWKKVEDDIQQIELSIENEKIQLETYEKNLIGTNDELAAARERVRKAEESDLYQGIGKIIKEREQVLKELEKQIEKLGDKITSLKELEEKIAEVKIILSSNGVEINKYDALDNLSGESDSAVAKIELYTGFTNEIKSLLETIRNNKYEIASQIKSLSKEIQELEMDKKTLESNQLVFDKDFIYARDLVRKELENQGIKTDVRFFVELINNITDEKWRKAVETFLGNKRFNLIVDGKYTNKALEIINANPALRSKVVISDKLPESEVKTDSAASLLEIQNTYARRYANYLLNGIHLCESVEELHDYPLGGIMSNGMLAKSYASNKMDVRRTKLFIGQDAIKRQLEDVYKELEKKAIEKTNLTKKLNQAKEQIEKLDQEWNSNQFDFDAPVQLKKSKKKEIETKTEIEKYKKDPGFTAILEERDKAKAEEEKIQKHLNATSQKIGGSKQQIENYKKEIIKHRDQANFKEKEFEEKAKVLSGYRSIAIEEYENLKKKSNNNRVIAQKTVDGWEKSKKDALDKLENLQLEYHKINGSDLYQRGESYIGYFRDEYRNLANVKIEEAQNRLNEQREKLQSAFVGDFVAELDESIANAKQEIDKINRELRKLPFGSDTYCFKMEERPERKLFFDICKKLHDYINNAEYYLNSIKDDEAAESELKEFMDIILAEEDESEYTDYRKYFTYDMKITSKQGNETVTANYSSKQGSASNGEKQTPYFIILAASLMQCYPRERSCARLAFIDEAFSALSKERIEQMVKYLEDNDFQVIYAAPPEKINSIGQHIQSTISLVTKERFTFAVEGLVKAEQGEGD